MIINEQEIREAILKLPKDEQAAEVEQIFNIILESIQHFSKQDAAKLSNVLTSLRALMGTDYYRETSSKLNSYWLFSDGENFIEVI